MKALTSQELIARYEACEEAASHLENVGWSDDSNELKQGLVVAADLRRRSVRLLRLAHMRKEMESKGK